MPHKNIFLTSKNNFLTGEYIFRRAVGPGSILRSHVLKQKLKKDTWEYSGIFQYSFFLQFFVEAGFFWNIPEYSIFQKI